LVVVAEERFDEPHVLETQDRELYQSAYWDRVAGKIVGLPPVEPRPSKESIFRKK
jgi:hypothetical protein